MIVVGLAVLFFLRGALWHFIIRVLELLGIFIGFVLVIVGVALLVGGAWMKRGPFGWGKVGT